MNTYTFLSPRGDAIKIDAHSEEAAAFSLCDQLGFKLVGGTLRPSFVAGNGNVIPIKKVQAG